MNSLPLSPLVVSFLLRGFTEKTAAYKSCVNLGLPALSNFFWFYICLDL